MIAYLEGKILAKEKNTLVIKSNGIGYEVRVTPETALRFKVGEEARFFTYFHVREDAQELYGVKNWEELNFLKMLTGVSGVGPRSALNILSLGTVEEIKAAIARSDFEFLIKVSGIGRKIAERIVVELKEKLNEEIPDAKLTKGKTVLGDVLEALQGLGYSLTEARPALREIKEEKNASEMLKAVLKILNKK